MIVTVSRKCSVPLHHYLCTLPLFLSPFHSPWKIVIFIFNGPLYTVAFLILGRPFRTASGPLCVIVTVRNDAIIIHFPRYSSARGLLLALSTRFREPDFNSVFWFLYHVQYLCTRDGSAGVTTCLLKFLVPTTLAFLVRNESQKRFDNRYRKWNIALLIRSREMLCVPPVHTTLSSLIVVWIVSVWKRLTLTTLETNQSPNQYLKILKRWNHG